MISPRIARLEANGGPPRPDQPLPPEVHVPLSRIARLFRHYRPRLAILLGLIVVSAGIGVVSPFLLRGILDTAIPQRDTKLLTLLVLGMIGVSVTSGAFGVVQTWLSNTVGQRVMHDLRAAVYSHLQRMSLAFFTRTHTGEVQSRIANDIGGIDNVVTSTATSIMSNVTTVLATLVAMLLLDWRLAVFSLVLLPFFLWLTRKVGQERKRITTVRQGRLPEMSMLVEESLSVSGILLGKTMGRGPELARRFGDESAELADIEVRSRMAGRWRMASVQMSFAVMPALVYWFAGQSIAHGGGAISIGTVVAFTTLQTRLLFPILSLLNVGLDMQTSLALFHRIFEYLDLPIDIAERADAVPLGPGRARGDVRFEGVGFAYDPEGEPTLRDIDVTVPRGARVAIVGETGSGKTTLGYLVARLYDTTAGRVTIDGVDVRDLSFADLSRAVGLVSQETYLFHETTRESWRSAKPDGGDEELAAAAPAAQARGLITSLPDAYNPVVGGRGCRFSGGEKQRVAIAGPVRRIPPILVLDEATSALDTETERAVQAALDQLAEGRTTIAIAHRLSTVRDADEIVVLDHGRIVERGSHAELLARGGRYAALAARAGEADEADALVA